MGWIELVCVCDCFVCFVVLVGGEGGVIDVVNEDFDIGCVVVVVELYMVCGFFVIEWCGDWVVDVEGWIGECGD